MTATLKEDTNSYSRVQQSSHLARAQRESNIRDTRYKPYASTRNQHTEGRPRYNNERTWKEKKLPPVRINEIEAENRKELHQPKSVPMAGKSQEVFESSSTSAMKLQSKVETIVKENNVTFRATNSRIEKETNVDDLIQPYDALRIDALNDDDHEIEEHGDEEMHEAVIGNED